MEQPPLLEEMDAVAAFARRLEGLPEIKKFDQRPRPVKWCTSAMLHPLIYGHHPAAISSPVTSSLESRSPPLSSARRALAKSSVPMYR